MIGGGGQVSIGTRARLIVDDCERWQRFLYLFLEQHPAWQVICEVPNGLDAVEKSLELQLDVILHHIGLPELNGIEAARQIHKLAPSSRILFLSESAQPEIVRERSMSAGAVMWRKETPVQALDVVIANGTVCRAQVPQSRMVGPG